MAAPASLGVAGSELSVVEMQNAPNEQDVQQGREIVTAKAPC